MEEAGVAVEGRVVGVPKFHTHIGCPLLPVACELYLLIDLFVYLSICLFFVYLFVCLSIYLLKNS